MPPRPKFTQEEIVQAALKIVSEGGTEALTAKALGDALGASARPIFTVFDSMKEVQAAVREAAMRRFESGIGGQDDPDMPLFKQVGMHMIRFAIREPKLFRLLFMQEISGAVSFDDVFGALGQTAQDCIGLLCHTYGLDREQAGQLFETVWIYTFGIGALCATGACRFPEERLGEMLSTEFSAVLTQIKSGGAGNIKGKI